MINRFINALLATLYFSSRAALSVVLSPLAVIVQASILSAGIILYTSEEDSALKKTLKILGLTALFTPIYLAVSLPIKLLAALISPIVGFISGFKYDESISIVAYHSPLSSYLHMLFEKSALSFIASAIGYQGELISFGQLFCEYFENVLDDLTGGTAGLDGEQSSHTASVHKSVSDSATKLMTRYKDTLSAQGEDKIISELSQWLDGLNAPTGTINVARRCLSRLASTKEFDYEDPKSKVTLKQLLALVWLAAHDNALKIGTDEDMGSVMLEGIVEIQRGYNLNAKGVDDGLVDQPICPAGAFTKLIEKLVSIHPDAEIDYVTKFSAGLKLQRVVVEEIRHYLTTLSFPQSPRQVDERNQLITSIVEGIDDVIWGHVSDRVSNRLFVEFGALFKNDRNSDAYIKFIEAGQYTNLKEDDFRDLRPVSVRPSVFRPISDMASLAPVQKISLKNYGPPGPV